MTVYLKDYLEQDAPVQRASSLLRALEALEDGGTLRLGGGRLEISPDGAFRRFYCMSNNDRGEKPIAFPLRGRREVTIDGEGAELVFRGGILPFVIDGCQNVTVKNLSVDWRFPQYGQARVVESEPGRTVLEFDGREFFCRVEEDGCLCFFSEADGWAHRTDAPFVMEFDPEKRAPSAEHPCYFAYCGPARDHGFLGGLFRDVRFRQLSENRIVMSGDPGFVHAPGCVLAINHSRRNYPGFLVTDASDVLLENIRICHAPAMGLICQLSENITLDRVNVDVREGSGRMVSTCADATHFVGCRGRIVLRDCRFFRMLDDAANLHGIYLKGVRKDGPRSFTAGYGHPQQVGMNIFRPGDTVRLIGYDSAETEAELTVDRSEQLGTETLRVYLRQEMPELSSECVAENASAAPEILITGCACGSNRPRGFLLCSAGRTVVENCVFSNMNEGIALGGEFLNWYESGAVRDVTVRGCDFRNSAYAGGAAVFGSSHTARPGDIPCFHGRVRIENNRFTMNGRRFLDIQNVGDLTFRGNEYVRDPSLPFHGELENGGLYVRNCGREDCAPVLELPDRA